jgi:hypothetical protein
MDCGIAARFPELWQVVLLQTGQENIQPPIQWVAWLITTGCSGEEAKLPTHPTPPGLRMNGDTPPLPRTSLCRAQEELYSYHYLICGRMVWNVLNWPKTGSSNWPLWTRHWSLGFHCRLVISWSHERPAGRNLLEFYMLVISWIHLQKER